MENIFIIFVVSLFFIESAIFILFAKNKADTKDKYYKKYKNHNLTAFTFVKGLIIGCVVYIVRFPGVLALGSGKLGAYIIGILYCIIALKFLWHSLSYFFSRKKETKRFTENHGS